MTLSQAPSSDLNILEPIGIIGGTGKMGDATLRGLLAAGIDPANIMISNGSGNFKGVPYKVGTTTNNDELIARARTVLLSVKPQVFTGLEGESGIGHDLDLSRVPLAISVMAGVTEQVINTLTGAVNIVRAMPTLGAQFGMSATVWHAVKDVTEQQREATAALLSVLGLEHQVDSEDMVDWATAHLGSFPGFVARFQRAQMEHLRSLPGIDLSATLGIYDSSFAALRRSVSGADSLEGLAGFIESDSWIHVSMARFLDAHTRSFMDKGVPKDAAFENVRTTFEAALRYMHRNGLSPEQLENAMTRIEGTTWAGRNAMNANGIGDHFSDILTADGNPYEGLVGAMNQAAYDRAKELAVQAS